MTDRTVTICGRTYPLRFSLRVIKSCCERYGSMEKLFAVFNGDNLENGPQEDHPQKERTQEDHLQEERPQEGGQKSYIADLVDALVWMLSALLDAGYRYARANGEAAEDPPDADTLLDVLTMAEIQGLVLGTISGDSERTVEVESEKNGETAAETVSSPPPGSSGMG